MRSRNARTWFGILCGSLLLSALGCAEQSAVAQHSAAYFTVAERGMEYSCANEWLVIRWQTGEEHDLVSFKVHRQNLDKPESSSWVNQYHLQAKGAGNPYAIVDTRIIAGQRYHYRAYGFDESGQLSDAYQVSLDGNGGPLDGSTRPTCLYAPFVASGF